jgi:hypothetical protein
VTTHRAGERIFEAPPISQRLALDFDHAVTLLGYDLPQRRVEPGEAIPLKLYWQSQQVAPKAYFVFVHGVDREQKRLGGSDRRLSEEKEFAFWYPGEIVADPWAVELEPETGASLVWLRLGLYEWREGEEIRPVPIYFEGDHIETSLTIGPLRVGDPPPLVKAANFEPDVSVGITLGEPASIRLRGYEMTSLIPSEDTPSALEGGGEQRRDAAVPTAGTQASDTLQAADAPTGSTMAATPIVGSTMESELKLTLYWESLAPSSVDWSSFVHLRNERGEIVAQHDQPAGGGELPSSLWEPGEVVADPVRLALPPELKAGSYTLVAGLYRQDTGERLPVPSSPENVVELFVYNRK